MHELVFQWTVHGTHGAHGGRVRRPVIPGHRLALEQRKDLITVEWYALETVLLLNPATQMHAQV